MQNTQQFIEQHGDELHDLTCDTPSSESGLEDNVQKFVQEKGADVDVIELTMHLAQLTLHNYYDDGGEGGSIMYSFFEDVGYDGYTDLDEFIDDCGSTRKVAEHSDFVRYAMQRTAVDMGLDISELEAYEHNSK